MTARMAFGAEFVGAEGFLNSPTYGLPPQFMVDALQDCIAQACADAAFLLPSPTPHLYVY